MSETSTARGAVPMSRSEDAALSVTRKLLAGGVVAGPLYLGVGLVEAFTRPGYDIRRHDLSLLSNGDLGWIHIALLELTGLLVVAGAVGMRRALRSGRGRTWGPLLVAVYGLGMVGAGIFSADPALGFPPGTPADAHDVSWHGLLHFVTGGIGFLSLIAGCFVLASRFAWLGERGWAAYSVIVGVVFFAGFAGIAVGSGNGWAILGLWIGVVLAFSWVSAVSARLMTVSGR